MFENLPTEVLAKLCDELDAKAELSFALTSHDALISYKKRMQSRLAAIFSAPSNDQFLHLLTCLGANEKDGFAILRDDTCKKILIEKKSKDLPHWMLTLVECQPALIPFLLADEGYRYSLEPDEFHYLIRNYPHLASFVEKHNISPPDVDSSKDLK